MKLEGNYRILSIDPGINTTGMTVGELDRHDRFRVIHVETVKTQPLVARRQAIAFVHDEHFAKAQILRDRYFILAEEYEIDETISEDAFFNPKRPDAYRSLLHVIAMFEQASYEHDPTLPFSLVKAGTVKKFMGVCGNSGDKELMRSALLKSNLLYDRAIDPENLDEHSIDSICIGYWRYAQLLDQVPYIIPPPLPKHKAR